MEALFYVIYLIYFSFSLFTVVYVMVVQKEIISFFLLFFFFFNRDFIQHYDRDTGGKSSKLENCINSGGSDNNSILFFNMLVSSPVGTKIESKAFFLLISSPSSTFLSFLLVVVASE
jgi:hypothetical protein